MKGDRMKWLDDYQVFMNFPKTFMGDPVLYRVPYSRLAAIGIDEVCEYLKSLYPEYPYLHTWQYHNWTYIGLRSRE